MFKDIKDWIMSHKKLATAILAIVIAALEYFGVTGVAGFLSDLTCKIFDLGCPIG